MSKDTPTSIVEKIRKLLSLADPSRGATEEESKTAFARAQELMAKYGIEHADIPEEELSARGPEVTHEYWVTGRVFRDGYETYVAAVIKECFGVKILWTKTRVGGKQLHTYLFIGEALDIELAKAAVPVLISAMRKGIIRYMKERQIEKWRASFANPYYFGVMEGYIHVSEEGRARAYSQATKEQKDRFAIVLADKAAAITKYTEDNFRPKSWRRNRSFASEDARAAGVKDGSTLSLVNTNKLK